MKAIFGVAAPVRPPDRAASAGEAVSVLVAGRTAETRRAQPAPRAPRRPNVDATAAACPLPAPPRTAPRPAPRAPRGRRDRSDGRARRSGNGHVSLTCTIALVLLASCWEMSRSTSTTPPISTNRSPLRSDARSPTEKRSPESGSRPRRISPPVLGVNTNTVLRSLRVLRDEGLLEFRRGRGISVAGTPERGAVVQRARELVDFARHQGYRLDELIEIIEDVG